MAKTEWVDDGRRCKACGGTGKAEPLYPYMATWDGLIPVGPDDFHPTCVGAYLSGNPSCTLRRYSGMRETPRK